MALRFAGPLTVLVAVGTANLLAQSASSDKIGELHNQATTAESSGDLATAASKYEELIKLAPRLAPAYNNLGLVYFKEGQYAHAAAALERGLKVDPKMSSASALLGMTYFQMQEYAKARPRLEAAVAANPSDNNAEFLLVNDLTKLGDFQQAAPLPGEAGQTYAAQRASLVHARQSLHAAVRSSLGQSQ